MINDRIEAFKSDIYDLSKDAKDIYLSHIRSIPPYLFIKDPGIETAFFDEISKAFKVDKDAIIICGSSCTGYSISPDKLFNAIDKKYAETSLNKDKSDIDVAIVSKKLYQNLRHKIYKYTNGLNTKWNDNEYYPKKRNSQKISIECNFYKYNYKGWFRPDFKPRGFEISQHSTYEILKRTIKDLTGRKLSIAIYEEDFFLKDYNINNIKNIRYSLSEKVL